MAIPEPQRPIDIKIEVIDNGFLVTKGTRVVYCKDEAALVSRVEKYVRYYARIEAQRSKNTTVQRSEDM